MITEKRLSKHFIVRQPHFFVNLNALSEVYVTQSIEKSYKEDEVKINYPVFFCTLGFINLQINI